VEIREYQPSDCKEMAELFYQTVHSVNIRDYTREQIDAWASGNLDLDAWNRSFLEHETFVAIEVSMIVGFGDMDETGYLDRLFVHKDYQRKGIAEALCVQLEGRNLSECFTTHASITAKPFFEKRGYTVVKEQSVQRRGISLKNFIMEKNIR
jgi:putative acetyltransferase